MSCQPDVKAVCGKYQFLSGLDSVQVQGEISNWNCMRILESVMLLKLDGIYPLGGYKEGLGTGSKSLSQSGEGADLLLRIKKNGGRILALNTIAARDLRERPTHSFIKNFGYGIGFSSVAKLHKMRKRAFIRSFTPIIRYIFRKKLPDSPENFASTFAVSCGRLMGILTPKRFLIASGNKK